MSKVLSEYGNLIGIPDNPNKADKVSNAVSGNFAGLDANGNLTDSGFESADFEPALTLTETTITGNPIVVDGKKLAVSTKITFDPIQAGSGDPSPTNVRELSGRDSVKVVCCGFNIWDEQWEVGSINSAGVDLNNSTDRIRTKYILIAPDTDYFINIDKIIRICEYDPNKTFTTLLTLTSSGDGYAFRSSEKGAYIKVAFQSTYGTTYNNDICINISKTEGSPKNGDYVTYSPITDISQSLPETVYGGTLDVESGELTVDRGIITYDGSSDEEWSLFNLEPNSCRISAPSNLIASEDSISNMYISGYITSNDLHVQISNTWVYVKDSGHITDLSSWKTFLASNQLVICYKLKEPYTLQLTPAQVRLLATQSVVTSNGSSIKLTVSNTKVASIEAVDSVKESVDALGGYISACIPGDAVDLIPYTSSTNTYQFPCDGYVYLNGRGNTSGYIRALLYGRFGGIMTSLGMNITGIQERQSVFVRKGMRCYIETNIADTSTIIAQYKPFVSI